MLALDEIGELRRPRGGDELGLTKALLVAHEVGESLPDLQVEVGRDLAELPVEGDDQRPPGASFAHDHREVARDRRRADAALRREARDEAAGGVRLTGEHGPRPDIAGALEPDQE